MTFSRRYTKRRPKFNKPVYDKVARFPKFEVAKQLYEQPGVAPYYYYTAQTAQHQQSREEAKTCITSTESPN
jgi:hypothetical protein